MDWAIENTYDIRGDGWTFEARLELEGGLSVLALGSYEIGIDAINWPIDTILENETGDQLAFGDGLRACVYVKDLPGLLESLMDEDGVQRLQAL